MKIEIDRQKCVGLGECDDEAPAIFKLDSFGKAVLREQHPTDTERTLAAFTLPDRQQDCQYNVPT